jgi:hypothetical protein
MEEHRESEQKRPAQVTSWVPSPDPTALTGEMVDAAKDQLRREIHAATLPLSIEINGIHKVIDRFESSLGFIPKQISLAIEQVERLYNEKFDSIKTQIKERDTQVDRSAVNVADQITKAMAAQEKLGTEQNKLFTQAAQKSEDATKEQISGLDSKLGIVTDLVKATMTREEVGQLVRGVTDKIDGVGGLASRLEIMAAKVESMAARGMGRHEQSQSNTQQTQWVIGLCIVIGLAVAGFILKTR